MLRPLSMAVIVLLQGTAVVGPLAADSLQVGKVFPATRFLRSSSDSGTELASLSDLPHRKTIAFVFASW